GFPTRTQDVAVQAGEATLLDLTLDPAGVRDTLIVTAARERRLLDEPASVSVLPADVIETAPSSSIGDLVRQVPGVNAIQASNRDLTLTARTAAYLFSSDQRTLLDGRT